MHDHRWTSVKTSAAADAVSAAVAAPAHLDVVEVRVVGGVGAVLLLLLLQPRQLEGRVVLVQHVLRGGVVGP